MKNIVIRGGYGATNFGDDALMKVIYDQFIIDKGSVTFSSTYDDYLKKLAPLASFIPFKETYHEFDILIYGGGTQFFSFQRKPNIFKRFSNFINSKNKTEKLKAILGAFKKSYIPEKDIFKKVALGVGVGPFLPTADPVAETKAMNLFKSFNFISVRDSYSNKKMQEWGIKNYHYLTDICYVSNHSEFLKNNSATIKKIGIIVRDWYHTKEGDSYKSELLNSSQILRDQGYSLQYIIFAEKRDPNWLSTLKSKKEDLLIWEPDSISVDEFINKLSGFDLLITARYHGAVYSSLLGIPFLSIAVEQKLKLINEVHKNGSESWDFPFNSDKLIQKIEKINNDYTTYRNSIIKSCKEQVLLAKEMKSKFIDFVYDHNS